MTENGFWASLRKKIAGRLYAYKVNDRITAGIPDVWLSGEAGDLWMELKYDNKLPVRVPIDPKDTNRYLSLRQQDWLQSRYAEGRNVCVVIGSPEGHVVFPGVSWMYPITREEFDQKAVTTAELADRLVEELRG